MGDLIMAALKALGGQPPPPPNPAPPTPPDMGQPSGMANAPNPGSAGSLAAPPVQPTAPPAGETKGHKLLQILQGGIQGALAGRAASEQAVIQSGGHRSGGAGIGFEAGFNFPWQQKMKQQQLEQSQAQTELTKQQGTMIPIPGIGPVPAGLAKVLYPSIIGAGAKTGAAQISADSRETAAQTSAGAKVQGAQIGAQGRVQAAQIGQKFKAVPGVGLYDTEKQQVIPGTANGVTITPEIAQDYGLPQEFIGKPMNVSQLASLESNQIKAAPTVKSSTDPLGLTTTSTTTKQLPQTGGGTSRSIAPRGGAVRPQGGGGGAAPAGATPSGSGASALDSMAQKLVEGTMDPSQVPKRGASYTLISQKADAYSQQKYGKPFDMATAASDYQYSKNPQTQNVFKLIDGITAKGGSLEIAQKAAQKLPQMDEQTINNLFNKGATEFGSTEASNFHTAMLGLADEYSKVMGGGVSSDTGRQQGLDLLKAQYSKDQFKGAGDIIKQDLAARKAGLIGNNRYLQKQYGQQQAAASTGGLTAKDMLKKYPPR